MRRNAPKKSSNTKMNYLKEIIVNNSSRKLKNNKNNNNIRLSFALFLFFSLFLLSNLFIFYLFKFLLSFFFYFLFYLLFYLLNLLLEPIERANQVQVRADIDPMSVDLSMQNDSIGGMKEMVLFLLIFSQVFEKCSTAPPKRVLFFHPPITTGSFYPYSLLFLFIFFYLFIFYIFRRIK